MNEKNEAKMPCRDLSQIASMKKARTPTKEDRVFFVFDAQTPKATIDAIKKRCPNHHEEIDAAVKKAKAESSTPKAKTAPKTAPKAAPKAAPKSKAQKRKSKRGGRR